MSRTPFYLCLTLACLLTACSSETFDLRGTVTVSPCGPPVSTDACAEPMDATGPCAPAGEPAASVILAQEPIRTDVTGDTGGFRLRDLPRGTYGITVSAEDTVETRQVSVVEHPGSDRTQFVFTAAGTLQGRVEVPDGFERRAVTVQLACPPRSALTDDEGRFTFQAVPVGMRRLTASGLGIVTPESSDVEVTRGATTLVDLTLIEGRPPEQPGNRAPSITGPLAVRRLPDASGTPRLRPPPSSSGAWVRGDRIEVQCAASDPDGDPLQYVWSSTSGALEATGGDTAAVEVGSEDVGIACEVLDGRGGIDILRDVLPVHDPFFAGATLVAGGAVFANAYGPDFELVRWDGVTGDAQRWPSPGPQWRPHGSDGVIAYIDAGLGPSALVAGALPTSSLGEPSTEVLTADAFGVGVTDQGVVWVDSAGGAFFWWPDGMLVAVGTGFEAETVGTHGDYFVLRQGSSLRIYRSVTGATVPGNAYDIPASTGPIATDGERVAYWVNGVPTVVGPSGTVPLRTEPAGGAGRILLSTEYAAYSYYQSPLSFLEATVARVVGATLTGDERVSLGPSEVLDMNDNRLLVGRPRAVESEPSGDIWIVSLEGVLVP